jgi:hypothetical protein
LLNFSCPKNPDVEYFLKSKAIRFEQSDNARSYLILNSDNGDILPYFALSFKEVSLEQTNLSKSKIKQLDGINKNSEKVRAYLIGQIAKNFAVLSNSITLSLILDEVYAIIAEAKALVGGRAIILECEKNDKLIALYQANGFEILINTDDEPLVTMYTFIA